MLSYETASAFYPVASDATDPELSLAKAKYKMQKDCSSQPIHGFSFVCFGSSIFLSALLISWNKCQDNWFSSNILTMFFHILDQMSYFCKYSQRLHHAVAANNQIFPTMPRSLAAKDGFPCPCICPILRLYISYILIWLF